MTLHADLNQVVIEAEDFTLRPLRKSDQGLIERYASDSRVAKMTSSIPHPLPPGATEAFIALANAPERSEDVWAMDGSAQGHAEVMGLIGMDRMEDWTKRRQCEIGYWVAPAFWNAGIASKAVKAAVEANPLRAKTVFGSVFQDNPASARVLTGAGFDYLGDAEAFSVARAAKVATWTYLHRYG